MEGASVQRVGVARDFPEKERRSPQFLVAGGGLRSSSTRSSIPVRPTAPQVLDKEHEPLLRTPMDCIKAAHRILASAFTSSAATCFASRTH